ncbi:hypothetical protein N7471_009984 [Penicillium samsonianum]|uniref:uncharacterized protein n=1 Tax=Penicillium samsonianum TaxID=1882272 RepID=UPI00254674F8|nr:uncharacterized protein N7471_009984 [Penicillium samsonianum]KAJ6128767.1 hypothetical protein N7471_009984 [Penicillium samsonianum]
MEGLPDDSGSNAPSIGASQIREFPGSEAEQALTHDASTLTTRMRLINMDKRWLLTDVPKGFDEDSQLDCENLETQQTKKMWYRIKLLGGAPDWPVVDVRITKDGHDISKTDATNSANGKVHVVPATFFWKHKIPIHYDAAKAIPYEITLDPKPNQAYPKPA